MNHVDANALIVAAVSVLVAYGIVVALAPVGKVPLDEPVRSGFHPQPGASYVRDTIVTVVIVILGLVLIHFLPRLLNNGTRWP